MLLRLGFLESQRRRNILGIGRPRPRLRVSESIADDASVRLYRAKSIIRNGLCVVRVGSSACGPLVLDRISWCRHR